MKGWHEGALWWNCSVYSLWWWSHKSTHVIKMHRTKYTHISACSVQSLSHVRLFAPHGLQHARLPCPSPTPRAYSNSCPLSQWCHPTILSSIIPFSSGLQSFHQGLFTMSVLCIRWPKYWSFSFSISLSNEYSGLTGWISLQFKGLSRVFSSTTAQKH